MEEDMTLYRAHFIKSLECLDIETTNFLLKELDSGIEVKEFIDKSLFRCSQEYSGNLALSKDGKFYNIIFVYDEPSEEEIKSALDLQLIISNSLKRDELDEGKEVFDFETVFIAYEHIEESLRDVYLYGRDFSIKVYSFVEKIDDDAFYFIADKLDEASKSLSGEDKAKLFLKTMIGDGDVASEFVEFLKNNPPEKNEGSDLDRTIEFEPKKGGKLKISIRKATEEDLEKKNIDLETIKEYIDE